MSFFLITDILSFYFRLQFQCYTVWKYIIAFNIRFDFSQEIIRSRHIFLKRKWGFSFISKLRWFKLECSPKARETKIQSLVKSYQRLQKMVLDASFLNTQHYKVWVKDKVEQSRERSGDLPYTSVLSLLKKEPLGHPRLRSPTLLFTNLRIMLFNESLKWKFKLSNLLYNENE